MLCILLHHLKHQIGDNDMSIVLRASKWAPEVTAFGFTSLNITHRASNVRAGKDTFELSFTDQQGQDYTIKLYSESPNTHIVVDDGTDERIVPEEALPRDCKREPGWCYGSNCYALLPSIRVCHLSLND
jgi:hypothetical protein